MAGTVVSLMGKCLQGPPFPLYLCLTLYRVQLLVPVYYPHQRSPHGGLPRMVSHCRWCPAQKDATER